MCRAALQSATAFYLIIVYLNNSISWAFKKCRFHLFHQPRTSTSRNGDPCLQIHLGVWVIMWPEWSNFKCSFRWTRFCVYLRPIGQTIAWRAQWFFRMVIPSFLAKRRGPIVLVGDFNAVDSTADWIRLSGTLLSTPVDHALVVLVASMELVNVWKALRQSDFGFTYIHHSGSARIDRIYCSRAIKHQFTLIHCDTNYVSDHAAVHANCNILLANTAPRRVGRSIWEYKNCEGGRFRQSNRILVYPFCGNAFSRKFQ